MSECTGLFSTRKRTQEPTSMRERVNAMTLVSLSVSHRTTPVEMIEALAVPPAQLGDLLAELHAVCSVSEVLVLSTCNRVEVYVVAGGPSHDVIRAIAASVAAHRGVRVLELLRTARSRVDGAAAKHLFAVTCGLDSMAVGEAQIVSQVRDSARAAAAAGTTGPAIAELVDGALRTSKRARTETTISRAGTSLARAGVELASARLGGLEARDALVLGTGTVGVHVARLLRDAGVGRLSVVGRSEERAAEVAASVDGKPIRADDLTATLAEAHLLVTATGAAVPLVRAEQVRVARAQADGRPLFVLDLGMPPDVDPSVRRLSGVTLVDLKALGQHLAERKAPNPVPQVWAIVTEEAIAYVDRQKQAHAAPLIAALHARIGELAATELERLHHRLPDLSEEQRTETAVTVHRILRKVLHQPTIHAKELATGPDGPVYLDALRRLFDLDAPIPDHMDVSCSEVRRCSGATPATPSSR